MRESIKSRTKSAFIELIKFIGHKIPAHPLVFIGGVFFLIILAIILIYLTFKGTGTGAKFAVAFVLMLVVSVVTRFPDRFRPPLSFKVGMSLVTLITLTHGIAWGALFSIISVLFEARAAVEFPQQTPQTLIYRLFFNCFLPVLWVIQSENLIVVVIVPIIIMYMVSSPIRVLTGKLPPIMMLMYAIFNIGFNAWFLWLFGDNLYALLV